MYGNCHEIRGQVSVDLGNIPGHTSLDVDVPLANALPGDRLVINPSAAPVAGIITSSPRVKSNGVITVTVANVTAGQVAAGNAVVYDVSIIKKTGSV
jgi:hypothetical protein